MATQRDAIDATDEMSFLVGAPGFPLMKRKYESYWSIIVDFKVDGFCRGIENGERIIRFFLCGLFVKGGRSWGFKGNWKGFTVSSTGYTKGFCRCFT